MDIGSTVTQDAGAYDIQTPELVRNTVHHLSDVLIYGHVCRHGQCPSAKLLNIIRDGTQLVVLR